MSVRKVGAGPFVLLLAALGATLLLVSCDKEDGHDAPPPVPPVEAESAQPGVKFAPGQPLASAAIPEGKVEWLATEAAWRAVTPSGKNAPGFRLLYFRTPREYGCGLLETICFNDPPVLALLKERAAARFENLDGAPGAQDLARRYGVKETPALVVLDLDGGYAGTILGHRPPERLIKALELLAEKGETLRKRAAEHAAKLDKVKDADRVELLDAAAGLAAERRLYADAAKLLAILAAEPALKETRSPAGIFLRLAQALSECARVDEALKALDQAKAADDLNINGEEIEYRRAETLTAHGRFAEAAEKWAAYATANPNLKRTEAAKLNRLHCLILAEKGTEAAPLIKAALGGTLDEENERALRALLYEAGGENAALAAVAGDQARKTWLADALADGRVVVQKYSCYDCHYIVEPQIESPKNSCVSCHLLVKNLEQNDKEQDKIERAHPHFYRNCTRIRHLLRAPNLAGVAARVRPAFIKEYLGNPYDLRPHLEESMLRMNFTQEELDALGRYFEAVAELSGHKPPEDLRPLEPTKPQQPPAPEVLARGRQVFTEQKCYRCHQLGNEEFGADAGQWKWDEGRAEAPNLRFVRERMSQASTLAWIKNPALVSPTTRMPKFALPDEDRQALVAFLFYGELNKTPKARVLEKPTVAKAPTFAEIDAAVFQDTCVHCHQADSAGGAGNNGAYGFRARRLDLSSYAGMTRGSLQPDGQRVGILKPREGGKPPLILERLYRRVEEGARDQIAPFEDPLTKMSAPHTAKNEPGMPLGHPSLTPAQLALLEAWLVAGAPGPKVEPRSDPDKPPERRE